ncbi:MAG: hypothetical protein OEV45_00600 [Desulfobacteraceae bacterium]|nr:hypothetical protein [Desulfobacteraceae bacterium]
MKTIVVGVSLLLMISIFSSCGSSSPPYPSDEQLITGFENNEELFSKLDSDPENQKLLSSLGISRVLVRSTEPKLVLYEVWFQDLFGPGGCIKGYAYSEEDLSCVESIDEAITGPAGPKRRDYIAGSRGNGISSTRRQTDIKRTNFGSIFLSSSF